MTKKGIPIVFFIIGGLFLSAFLLATWREAHNYGGWLLMVFFLCIAFGLRYYSLLKGYSFTVMIFAAVSVSMYYPQLFIRIGDFRLSALIVPLMQIIMFGMGTGLSVKDFAGVVKMPKGVVVGVLCHYMVMPPVAFTITRIFNFPAEVAAGIILIGSCPNGLASNVMTYLARANLALSVTLTAVSTLLAPLMTPLFMQWLAGAYVPIDFWEMAWDITKIVIIPVFAGLVFNRFLHGKAKWLDDVMPVLSMAGIALIIIVITAAGQKDLLIVGPALVLAMLLHNTSGYVLGYWLARLLRMEEKDCRTIAIEVGLQNAGLGSSLALAMGKLSTVGLASAVFSPIMNITGSSLALWWRSRPLPEQRQEQVDNEQQTFNQNSL